MSDLDEKLTIAYGLVGQLNDAIGIQLDNLVIEANKARSGFESGVMPDVSDVSLISDRGNAINNLVNQYHQARIELERLKFLKEQEQVMLMSDAIGLLGQ